MSEFSQTHGAPEGGEASAAGAGVSAGRLLAQMRGAAGVHIATLATTLKVSVDKIEALEADRYDLFSDVVFMRALAAGVCRTLKQDPAVVLALLPGAAPTPLHIGRGINAAFKDRGPRGNFGSPVEPPRSRLLGAAVVLLLAGALAVALWPQRVGFDGMSLISRNTPAAPATPNAAAPPSLSPENQAPARTVTEPAGAQPTAPAAPAVEAPPAPASTTTTVATAVQGTAAAPAAAASAAVVPADAVLVIRASAPSWVQVRSSGGAVVLQKTLAAGESAPVPGAPPWSVTIGKADVTEVIVRGQPLDLATLARENVARFEVK